MATEFTPKKKSGFISKIKNYLLQGYIIRVDGKDDSPLEVIGRDSEGYLPSMGNIGQLWSEVKLIEELNCAHSNLYEVVDELKQVYSVRKVRCKGSGCCQYATHGYYLD